MAISKKIILVGHFGVGKTSLVKRFVEEKFSEQYITTIGVKIDKKVVMVNEVEVKLLIWDIAGEEAQRKIPQSYRLGAHGVLYVFDLNRPSTYQHLSEEIQELQSVLPDVPVRILGNKIDLIDDALLAQLKKEITLPFDATSAKTGEHVEEAFVSLAQLTLA